MADQFSIDNVSVGDMMDLEDAFGFKLGELQQLAQAKQIEDMSARHLAGLAFLALRAQNSEATPDEAKAMKYTALRALLQVEATGNRQQRRAAPKLAGSGPKGKASRAGS